MELCDLGDLESYIEVNPINPFTLKHFAKGIISGMHYIHHYMSICHLDLKPANILLQSAAKGMLPVVKIADFGLSRKFNQNFFSESVVIGSPLYCAPEFFNEDLKKGSSPINCDLWSMAVVLYWLKLQRHPFRYGDDKDTNISNLYYIRKTIIVPDIQDEDWNDEPELREIVEGVLHYLPTQRISWNEINEITKRWKLKKLKQNRKHWMNGSLLI